MSDTPEFRIPLRISTEQVQSDLEAVDALLKKIQRDADIAQRQVVSAFNKSGIVGNGAGQVRAARTMADVEATTKNFTPQQIQENLPGLAQAMQRLQQAQAAVATRTQQIEQQAKRGNLAPAPTPTQAARQRLADTQAQMTAQRVAREQARMLRFTVPATAAIINKPAQDAAAEARRAAVERARLLRFTVPATAAIINKPSQPQARGGAVPPVRAPQQAARQHLARGEAERTPAHLRTPAQQKLLVEGTPTFIDKLAKANARAAPAMDLYRMAGGRIPAAAGGVSRLFGGALELAGANPLAALGMLGLGATVGTGLAANESQTSFRRQQAALASATVGGPLLGNQRTLMGLQVSDIAKNLSIPQDQAQPLIQSLAAAGTGQGDLTRNLQSSVMLAGPNQLPYGDAASLAASLGTSGGLDAKGINRTFQDVSNVAHDSRISVSQLVQSMKALSTTAIGSAKDVGGLAAVQATIGASSGVNAGQLLAPALSATGAQAFQTAGILGMTPEQLQTAQTSKGGTSEIYDHISALVRRVGRGPHGVATAETVLNSTGLIDSSQLSPDTYKKLIKGMLSGSPEQATQKAAQLYTQADAQRKTEAQALQDTATRMRDLSTWTERVSYWFQNLTTHTFNGAPNAPPAKALPGMTLQATQAYARLDPLDYARQAEAAARRANNGGPGGGPGTGQGPGTGPDYTYGPGTEFARQQGVAVKNIAGSLNYATPDIVRADLNAGKRNHVSAATLLAMQSQESGFQSGAISKDGGYGLAQFTDPNVARRYLHVKPGQDWHAAALDPRRAAEGQAEYLADLMKQTHGNEGAALAMYNGGTHPGAVAQRYGRVIEQRAQQMAERLDVHVDVTVRNENGQRLPHAVTQQRTVVGGRTHGPPHGAPPH